ncbi:MAG: phenylalanine--tRNA ligase subunit beta, partial [Planctomycetota bacterium]|nr:phenylalanine--tRNA ligase subunit beta [Planctomycetota bacterium]
MLFSVTWMNDYLDPPASETEQGELLTAAGFPLEERVEHGDEVALDFEMMSNRGDCTCHVGLAREIAAISGRTLTPPECDAAESDDPVEAHIEIDNQAPDACPLYTARVIRGIEVGPSREDIHRRIEARGEIPRNNVVDATNFVLFELGQPTHAFDLDTLAGGRIEIRFAREGETFLPLGDGAEPITLTGSELVIADAEKPVALAGVKGGAASAVTESTRNILLEAATFDPVLVRRTSRLHNISSDSSFRFERGVSPLQVDESSRRLARLVMEQAGGTLCRGVLAAGAELPSLHAVSMRTDRCRALLGQDLADDQMLTLLNTLGFQSSITDQCIEAIVPCFRGDIHREIDLVEEVARMQGYDDLPVDETIPVRLAAPQPRVTGKRAVNDLLTGEGFIETVSHTLVNLDLATPFLAPGTELLRLEDEGDFGDTMLRPSLLGSLLRVRRTNRDRGASNLRLYEIGSAFEIEGDAHRETNRIGLLMDVDDTADGLRPLRGIVEALVDRLTGHGSTIELRSNDHCPWYAPGATIHAGDQLIGTAGRLAP